MRFFQINTLGDTGDRELALIDTRPAELEEYGYRLALGEPLGDAWCPHASVYLNPYRPGLILSDLLGNTLSYLIASTRVKDALEGACSNRVDLLPLRIYDQKRKLRGSDHWIINPQMFIDCVDQQASEIYYGSPPKRDIISLDRCVLDASRAPSAACVFRLPEDPASIVLNEGAARALVALRPSNLYLRELECSAGHV